jgi:hypothetical protein
VNTAKTVRVVFTEEGAVLQNTDNGATFTINSMGANIWRQLINGATRNEIVERVSTDFGAKRDEVCRDVDGFLTELEQKGLLQKEPIQAL